MAGQPKDNFSAQAAAYAAFRPHYPQQLYDFLYSLPVGKQIAWDCATGNGQVAAVLAKEFNQVYATDISRAQLQHAPKLANVAYLHCPAEATPMLDQSIDLVTVAQAVHWFDFERFNEEVRRVLKPGGFIAIWGYGLLQADEQVNELLENFYSVTVGPYWDAERLHIDKAYRSIPFPFAETPTPALSTSVTWTRQQLIGYLSSWSSVQHYIRQHGTSPLPAFEAQLQGVWPDNEVKHITFPIFMRVGQV
jgi:SAM-dependent methyltransferase